MWKLTVAVLAFFSLLVNVVNGDLYEVKNVNPPNGSAVIHITGAVNVTFDCELVFKSDGVLGVSQWRLLNFRGSSSFQDVFSYIAELSYTYDGVPREGIIPNTRRTFIINSFIEALDQTTLGCFGEKIYSEFYLFIYRPPSFQDLMPTLRFVKGERVVINLQGAELPAKPFPSFTWMVNGSSVSSESGVEYGYPTITFPEIQESHRGFYSLSANNYLLDGGITVSGTNTTNFTIEVLFGPYIIGGDTVRAVREGDNVSLLCGNQIVSNPQAVVTWYDPMTNEVLGGDTSIVVNENGSRINLYGVTDSQNGTWTCNVTVNGIDVSDPETLEILPFVSIGAKQFKIELIVVVAPSQPLALVITGIGITWATLLWDPSGDKGSPGVAFYIVTAVNLQGSTPNIISTTSEPYINMTNLLPRVNYQFSVQAVSSALGVDNPSGTSSPVNTTTLMTVPVFSDCSISSASGGITISFVLLHTGGLALTALNVTYFIDQEQSGSANVLISDRSVTIPSLVAGSSYTAVVSAANVEGTASIQCPAYALKVGIPQKPKEPEVEEVGEGKVTVRASTLNSGVVGTGNVYFILTIVMLPSFCSSGLFNELLKEGVRYGSEAKVMFSVDLEVGCTYNFSVLAQNEYGMSATNSVIAMITGIPAISTSAPTVLVVSAVPGSSLVGALIGSLVSLVVVCVIGAIIVLVLVYKFKSKKPWYASRVTTEVLNDERVPNIGMDINSYDDPNAAGFNQTSAGKELHYAELSILKPPSGRDPRRLFSKQPRVVRHEEPVTYATIDTFKKVPLDNRLTESNTIAGTAATLV